MIEEKLDRLIGVIEANTQALQILEAGRQASLEQLKKAQEAGDAAPAPRTRKKKDEAPAAAAEGNGAGAAESTSAASPAASQSSAPAADGLSPLETELKAAVTAHIEGGANAEEKAARVGDITAIMQHFGGKLVGPQSTLDDDQKAQALFYVRRYAAGCTVDFATDYDFAGDPTQGGLEAAAAGDDFDIG